MRIQLLDRVLIDRIAAGEVIERPASAVKELVENALDAEATRVKVAIEAGGRRLIRVVDDGRGMDKEDLALAVERHATSKLPAGDLAAIRTLGFPRRGAAVDRLGGAADDRDADSRRRAGPCAPRVDAGPQGRDQARRAAARHPASRCTTSSRRRRRGSSS